MARARIKTEPKNFWEVSPDRKCYFCKNPYMGWGHNPAPLSAHKDVRCCTDCNQRYVIPARIQALCESLAEKQAQAVSE